MNRFAPLSLGVPEWKGFTPFHLSVLFCGFLRGTVSWTNTKRSAPFWRWYWNPTPGASVSLPGQRIDLTPQTVALIASNTPFDKATRCAVEHFHIHFIPGPPYDHLTGRMFAFSISPEISAICVDLIARMKKDQTHAGSFTSDLHFLVMWALRQIPGALLDEAITEPHVDRAVKLMRENLHAPLSNELLAREAGMNTNAFIRSFRRVSGRTPQEFYTQLRLDKAGALLHASEKSIEEIAAEVGYCSRAHFSRVFAKMRGIGPAGYRRIRW